MKVKFIPQEKIIHENYQYAYWIENKKIFQARKKARRKGSSKRNYSKIWVHTIREIKKLLKDKTNTTKKLKKHLK